MAAPATWMRTPSARVAAAATAVLAVVAVLVAQVSTVAFVLAAAALLVLLGLAALRWPRAMLVALVLSPALVDLYAGQRLIPPAAQPVTRFFSEGLLLAVAAALAWAAVRKGTLLAALRHPFTAALAIFLAISVVSAVANAVPPEVAAAGLIFTLDAAVLYYLPRTVGYTSEEMFRTLWTVTAVVIVTAVLAIGQAILSPDLLGVTPVSGRSGEGLRVGSLVQNPNILGTLISMVLPFTMYSLVRSPAGRRRWLIGAGAIVLTLALLLTYSRGSWIGLLVGFGGVALVVDRRALLAFIPVLLLAYITAVTMPKGLIAGEPVAYDPFATTINRLQAVGQGRDLRTSFVENAIPIVKDHGLLGVGAGRYGGAAASIFGSPIHEQYGTDKLLTEQETVDNFWLHILVEGGVLGIVAFVAMLAVALADPIRALRRAAGSAFSVAAGIVSAAAVMCVASFTTMLLEGNTLAFLFWLLLGIGSLTRASLARTAGPGGPATPSGR